MKRNFDFGYDEDGEFRKEFKELKKIKTDYEFKKFVDNELKCYGLNIGDLERFFYDERNKALELNQIFKNRSLENFDFERLNDRLDDLEVQLELVGEVDKNYLNLVEKSHDFYKQYRKFTEEIIEYLVLEILKRKNAGDFR